MTLHVPFRRLAPVILALCSGSVFAATVIPFNGYSGTNGTDRTDFASIIYDDRGNATGDDIDPAFDNVETNGIHFARTGYSIVADFAGHTPDPSKPKVYVSEIEVVVAHNGNSAFSLWTSEDGVDWTPIPDAQNVHQTGKSVFKPKTKALQVKYVVDSSTTGDQLQELRIKGWWTSEPSNISKGKVARSIFFRDGHGTRGNAGFNGGSYSTSMFDGNFTGGLYQNGAGAELVFPTTTPTLPPDSATASPWYVTEVKVGHLGNSKYSLYYTTEPEPADILAHDKDPRAWTPIAGATGVQEAGTKTYLLNKEATAVKYVFDTAPSWTQAACEFEVWAMDADDLPCTHEHFDSDTAAWTLCKPATCTENAFEESFCPDCGERFEREVPLSKLGHDFVATLTRGGRHDRWGSGYVTCARTLEDPDTHETIWSCDYRIDFEGGDFNGETFDGEDANRGDVDLTTLGGPPINGVVQYTDLTVSSTGAEDGGVKPVYLMDGHWDSGWGHAWYAGTLSHNEYVQYAFGTPIELTWIEYSVLNQYQTVEFYKYDPETGVETLLTTIPIVKITNFEEREDPETGDITQVEVTPGYQRLSVNFFVSDKDKKIIVDAIRMRIGDYVDPDTGVVTRYIGENYGRPYHTIVCEIHPWGTIEGAGPLTHSPTTVMIFR